ncbi:LuxR C-terminal-related transcriptional regulator [Nocardioides sp.]|uniref:helix-turn-helix transcriptional regulator n=1 Tax=Nocardioides sp. TaxID=35761 RepID=UPI003783299B
MAGRPTRVGIVSPQEVLIKGLAAMLAEHPHRSAVTTVDDAQVVLYDVLGVYRNNGSDLDEIIGDDGPVVVAISRDLRPDLRARALAAGAHGWISMSVDSHELVAAVEAAVEGRDLPGRTDRLGTDIGLTPREVEVLSLIAQGKSNIEIAERLFLSINSVKTYIRSAYAKIGATSRSRAVAWCLQHGFAPPED